MHIVCVLVFLGMFARLGKATINFVMYVRPPARIEYIGSHWTDLYDICWVLF
jgi:hypothetical protein